eukprot:638384-Rhodomonas_salina.1
MPAALMIAEIKYREKWSLVLEFGLQPVTHCSFVPDLGGSVALSGPDAYRLSSAPGGPPRTATWAELGGLVAH